MIEGILLEGIGTYFLKESISQTKSTERIFLYSYVENSVKIKCPEDVA
jgi:hypothetical protein